MSEDTRPAASIDPTSNGASAVEHAATHQVLQPAQILRLKNQLTNTGRLSVVAGVLLCLGGLVTVSRATVLGMYILAGAVLTAPIPIALIVLGRRISTTTDANTRRYVGVLVLLSFVILTFAIAMRMWPGTLVLLLLMDALRAGDAFNRLSRHGGFNGSLVKPSYLVSKRHWITLTVTCVVGAMFLTGLALGEPGSPSVRDEVESVRTPQAQAWAEFTFPESKFAIAFPGTPTHEQEEKVAPDSGERITVDSYGIELPGEMAYLVTVSDCPRCSEPSAHGSVLEAAIDSMGASFSDNRLVESRRDGSVAEVELVNTKETIRIRGRIVASEERLYVLMTVTADTAKRELEYRRFVDSFRSL